MTQSESSIQQQIFLYYQNKHCTLRSNPKRLILSIPNESNGVRAAKLISMGLKKGAADLMIIDEEGKVYFVEVKTPTGHQSPAQKSFESEVKKMGIKYAVVRSLEEFLLVIKSWQLD